MAEKEKKAAKQTQNEEIADIEDLPQEITESYGTGVHPLPGFNIGEGTTQDELAEYAIASPGLTAADEDAVWQQIDDLDDEGSDLELTAGDVEISVEQAATVGDEVIGGTAPTPDQDIVDAIGQAVGIEMADTEYVHTAEILETRDDRRWELDPKSAEDYDERGD